MRIALLVCMLVTSALALDVHSDFRSAYGTCPTWGNGHWGTVRPWVRMRVRWDGRISNYPISWQATVAENTPGFMPRAGTCQYVGDPPPVPATTGLAPGEFEWVVPGSQTCAPKHVFLQHCIGGPNDGKQCALASRDCPSGDPMMPSPTCVPSTVASTSYPVAYMWVEAEYNGGGEKYPSGCIWDLGSYGAPPAP